MSGKSPKAVVNHPMEGEEVEAVAFMPLPEKTSRMGLSRATFTRAPWEQVSKRRSRSVLMLKMGRVGEGQNKMIVLGYNKTQHLFHTSTKWSS